MKKSLFVVASAITILASGSVSAQTTLNGPYYASPSWDQSLPAAQRFIVLSNMNNDAVLDRETGLVWQRAPSAASVVMFMAYHNCLELKLGGHMGWRLPKSDELFSLLDPTQITDNFSTPALPAGHPFVVTPGNDFYWTADQDAPPFNNNANLIFVATSAGGFSTGDTNFNQPRAWCVRGPGGTQMSP
jgi:hypothetical protein